MPSLLATNQRIEITLPGRQIVYLFALLIFGVALIGATVNEAILRTIVLLIVVAGGGLWLSVRESAKLGDPKLGVLGDLWLIKVFATLVLLFLGWIPQLDPSNSSSWGYDPQRYYQYSWDLVQQQWSTIGLEQNYQGILFYYGAALALFGHNPVVPALVNCTATLIGTLFIIRCAYSLMPTKTPADWYIAFILLIPEIIWYDVMTSRETLMAMLVAFSVLSVGKSLCGVGHSGAGKRLLLVCICLLLILTIRTSVIIPVLLSIWLMLLTLRSKSAANYGSKMSWFVFGIVALMLGPLIQRLMGGYDIDYLFLIERLQSPELNVASNQDWGEQSIGLLLLPTGPIQSVLFLFPRMLLYLAAPLPNVFVSVNELASGSWNAWQTLMTIPTSVLMLVSFPYVLAATSLGWSRRRDATGLLVFPISFWVNFAAVSGGNLIIHERYRLLFTLMLFVCAWIGYTRASQSAVRNWSIWWFGFLGIAASFYLIYKAI